MSYALVIALTPEMLIALGCLVLGLVALWGRRQTDEDFFAAVAVVFLGIALFYTVISTVVIPSEWIVADSRPPQCQRLEIKGEEGFDIIYACNELHKERQ